MRYFALWVYASVLQVAGFFMIVGSILAGIFVASVARSSGDAWIANVGLCAAVFCAALGVLAGLAALACGQLCNVWRDTEHNTRLAATGDLQIDRQEW